MKTRKILITGAAGMLGKDVSQLLTSCGDFFTVGVVRDSSQTCHAHQVVECDLTNIERLGRLVKEIAPDTIIHCAAVVNLDLCEQNHRLADLVHVEVTKTLAGFKPGQCRLVYVSTDSVFDGEKGDYRESDEPRPINYYALTKRQGEIVSLGGNENCAVLRTNIYGFHERSGNSLVEWAIANLRTGKEINGFNDVFFNPLYTRNLAKLVLDYFLDHGVRGIWHLGTEQYSTKYDFILLLARVFGFSESLVKASSIEEAQFKTPRPKRTTLNIEKLKSFANRIPTLFEGMEDLLRNYRTN